MKHLIINILLIVILVGGSFLVGAMIGHYGISNLMANAGLLEPINDTITCQNKSLSDTANCLREYVSTFYNYTPRMDTIKSLEDIKVNGGDCYDYSHLYVRLAEQLNFTGQVDVMDFAIGRSHAIAIIKSNNTYCVLDQLSMPFCTTLII